MGELVGGNAGFTLPDEAAEVIHKRTDGNPFFVGEVIRQVTPGNLTEGQEWANIVPEGVRDAIGRRLNGLSDQCNEMLTTASIVGREFTSTAEAVLRLPTRFSYWINSGLQARITARIGSNPGRLATTLTTAVSSPSDTRLNA